MVERGSQRFSDAIEGILESLDERDAFILRKRMAWGDKWATHQEIGDQLKLSRQRIKQIEDVILEGVRKNQIWKEKMEAVIDQALTDRDTGLPLVGLEVVDAWFAGVVETEETFALALSQFGSNRFFVVKANDFSFVTSISQPEWDAIVVQASQLLEAASSLNWTKSKARENVGALLVDRGKELREELFVSASKDAVFSSASGEVEPKLIAFGRGIEAQVEAVLTDSDRPLHYTEIAKRLTEKGRVISPAQVAGRVQRCGLLFNRGTYGLAKHLQFSEDEVASIVEAVEELVATSPNRQWHCSEFVEMLEESGLEVDGRLTHYTVSIVLSRSDYLVDLGRFVWTANTAKPLATSDRMNKRQAIELLLRNEGRPMTHKEIRDRLFPQRGLGKVFQIFADEYVIRISEGVWGLFDRDVPINPSEIDRILCMIGKEIERTQKGIHVSEVTDLLKAKSDVESGPVDPILVLSLAQRNGRFRTNSAGFIYHNDWSDARRLRPPEALLQVLEQAGPEGLEAHELVEKATALLGREIHKYHIYNPLEAIGAKYNEATRRWQLIQAESNAEAEESESQ